jgi:nucleolar protein 12
VRDPKTRVGKGFAYVQFTDENAVEAALLFNDKKFPPLLPRKIRVVRAKSMKRNASKRLSGRGKALDHDSKSMAGRAGKLLGHAGAANFKAGGDKRPSSTTFKPPEAFVFEGHRASSGQGTTGMKLGGSGRRKDKSRSHSNKRTAAWKAAGGKKKATK